MNNSIIEKLIAIEAKLDLIALLIKEKQIKDIDDEIERRQDKLAETLINSITNK